MAWLSRWVLKRRLGLLQFFGATSPLKNCPAIPQSTLLTIATFMASTKTVSTYYLKDFPNSAMISEKTSAERKVKSPH